MMDWIKKQGIAAWIICASAVLAFIGFIIYIVTSTTGFLAGQTFSALPIVFTVFAILGIIALLIFSDKMSNVLVDLAILAIGVLLIVSFVVFMVERVPVVADVHFIPVNYPAAEEETLNTSIVGFVFYGLSIVTMIAAAFFSRITKKV